MPQGEDCKKSHTPVFMDLFLLAIKLQKIKKNGLKIGLRRGGEEYYVKQAAKVERKYLKWISVKDKLPQVGKEVLVLTTEDKLYFGHIVDKKVAKNYKGWNIPNVEYWLPFVDPKDK